MRSLAAEIGLRPTKRRGQNFVVDPNTVRRIVDLAGLRADDVALEVGPGLGSLTLGLLGAAGHVTAVEIDPALAEALPHTVARYASDRVARLRVVRADAQRIAVVPGPPPTALVANLPYNVAVPVLLHLLGLLPSLRRSVVMVQAEVADRLAAAPGSRSYGVPSPKVAWFARARRAGPVPRSVFWPVPRVDSALVAFEHHAPPTTTVTRAEVFAVVDAAFAARRKTLRATLAGPAGSASRAGAVLRAAGVDPGARGETLALPQFVRIAEALCERS